MTTLSPSTSFDSRTHYRRPSVLTLTSVQLRSLASTRSTVTLVAVAALVAGATGGGQTLTPGPHTFGDVAGMALLMTPYFLVALGALLLTSEYTHRTVLTTYALVPRRGWVLAAKEVAVTTVAVVAAVLGLVAAGLIGVVVPLLGIEPLTWSLAGTRFAVLAAGLVMAALIGLAWGMTTGSVAIALAVYLVWPMVATLIGGYSTDAAGVLAWVRPDALYGLMHEVTGTTVAQTVVSILLWIVVPALIGYVRLTKAEVR